MIPKYSERINKYNYCGGKPFYEIEIQLKLVDD